MECRSASTTTVEELASLFTRAFKGYIAGDLSFTGEQLAKYAAANGVSFERSYIFTSPADPSTIAAFSFTAVRPDKPTHMRVAGFGVIPECKGQGVGSQAVRMVIEEERKRGTTVMELEAITTNDAAVKLYSKFGFATIRQLWGWERGPMELEEDAELQECSLVEVDDAVKSFGDRNSAWQTWPIALDDATKERFKGFKLGNAFISVSDPGHEKNDGSIVKLRSLVVEPESRRKGHATRLIKAVMAKFPGKKYAAMPFFAKEYGDMLGPKLGFTPMSLAEYQMQNVLN